MGDKKKPAAPPAKTPDPPAKGASPPTTPAPGTTQQGKEETPPPTPAIDANLADVPVSAEDNKPVTGPTVAPGLPKLTLPPLLPDLKVPPPALAPPFQLPPAPPIDWLEMRRPFLNRGVPFGDKIQGDIETQWTSTYKMMIGLGMGPDLSLKIANTATPIAIDNALKFDHPTFMEQSDRDMEKMLGKPVGTFTIGVITPGTLGAAIKLVTGKTVDLSF